MITDNDQDDSWLRIYAIYDKKGERFDTPYFAHSRLFAKRRYLLMMEEDRSPLSMWPGDFELHMIGRYNVRTNTLIEEKELVLEGNSIEIRKG